MSDSRGQQPEPGLPTWYRPGRDGESVGSGAWPAVTPAPAGDGSAGFGPTGFGSTGFGPSVFGPTGFGPTGAGPAGDGAGAGAGAPAGRHAQAPEDEADGMLVRPFMLTGGRTQPLHDGLRVESMVCAAPAALSAPLRFELRRIVELCQRPLSVAEVAVGLRVPLGVTRVLIADLVTSGLVSLEQSAEISIELIERIRDRVRAL